MWLYRMARLLSEVLLAGRTGMPKFQYTLIGTRRRGRPISTISILYGIIDTRMDDWASPHALSTMPYHEERPCEYRWVTKRFSLALSVAVPQIDNDIMVVAALRLLSESPCNPGRL